MKSEEYGCQRYHTIEQKKEINWTGVQVGVVLITIKQKFWFWISIKKNGVRKLSTGSGCGTRSLTEEKWKSRLESSEGTWKVGEDFPWYDKQERCDNYSGSCKGSGTCGKGRKRGYRIEVKVEGGKSLDNDREL